MVKGLPEHAKPLCPSAQPNLGRSMIIGVVRGTAEEPSVSYLSKPHPVTDEVLKLADPVSPAEVFRFAAPCMRKSCAHFKGDQCHLAKRIVALVPKVAPKLPACAIRS